ncbi:MAG: hypothetical protein KAI28_08520, partial [Sphingomonadales bacterium]|nr:hypothetical protein [Sphingomonadales bacterium]
AAFSGDDDPIADIEVITPQQVTAPARPHTSALAPENALVSAEREKALNALEELNTAWRTLEAMSPALWAEAEYSAARNLYASGDEAYGADNFLRAKMVYEQTLEATQELLETSTWVHDQAIETGQSKLDEKAYTEAKDHFELALAITADDEKASIGLNSALHGADIDRLLVKAAFYKDSFDYGEARTLLNEALGLDATRSDAKAMLRDVRQGAGTYQLSQLISSANESLSAKKFDDAIALFNKALKMSPTNKDALSGKDLALKEKKSHSLATLRVAGIRAEALENWAGAISAYQAALGLDAEAHFASEGLTNARIMKALYDEMAVYLNTPKRLSSPAVANAARALSSKINALENAPSGLIAQNEKLAEHLGTMLVSVPVRVISDNRTTIHIQKIGALGHFKDKTVNLKSGRYVFIGKRKGYADKRVVVDIPADATSLLVKVVCDEKI